MAYNSIIVPSNPEDLVSIKNSMDEISNSMTRIDSERDHIKDIKKQLKEDFKIPLKLINKIARAHHKMNFVEEQTQNEDFEMLYMSVNNDSGETV